jgi:hypothetical protein
VVDWWCIRDAAGFRLFQYHMKRVAGQPPLPEPRTDWGKHTIKRTWGSIKQLHDDDDGGEEVIRGRVKRHRVVKKIIVGRFCECCGNHIEGDVADLVAHVEAEHVSLFLSKKDDSWWEKEMQHQSQHRAFIE